MSLGLEHVSFSASDLQTSEATLEALGGLLALEDKVDTSFAEGIKGDADDVEERRAKYGTNKLEEAEIDSWLAMFIGTYTDTLFFLAQYVVTLHHSVRDISL